MPPDFVPVEITVVVVDGASDPVRELPESVEATVSVTVIVDVNVPRASVPESWVVLAVVSYELLTKDTVDRLPISVKVLVSVAVVVPASVSV